MTAYVFAAEGFEELELIAPVDILRRGGVEVRIVGVTGASVTGSHGITLQADCSCGDVILEKDDCVILPGGLPGVTNLQASDAVEILLAQAVRENLTVGAICAAPSILQRRGYLNGRQFTCYPGFADKALTGTYVTDPVVCDGPFITAEGAGAALAFGGALLAKMKGKTEAERVLSSMKCR